MASGHRVTVEGAARHLAFADFVHVAPRPKLLENEPDVPDRLRGALGRRLEDLAADGGAMGADAARLWSLLFGPAGGVGQGRPYVLRVDVRGESVRVVWRLFGAAVNYWQPAAAALERALASGIAVRLGGRHRVPLASDRRAMNWYTGVPVAAAPARATLMFRTPLAVRSGRYTKTRLGSLPALLAARTERLLAWQGLTLAADRAWLAAAEDGVQMDGRELAWRGWTRHSARTGAPGMPLGGFVGPLRISGDLRPIWPLLCLGAITHIGSETALGLGRYDLLAGI